MTSVHTTERLGELLTEELDRALSAEEERELDALLAKTPGWSRDDLALAAASVERALLAEDALPSGMPTELEARLLQAAEPFVRNEAGARRPVAPARPEQAPQPLRRSTPLTVVAWSGWGVAAAAVVLLLARGESGPASSPTGTAPIGTALTASSPVASSPTGRPVAPAEPVNIDAAKGPRSGGPTSGSAREERARLLGEPDVVQIPWSHTQDPLSKGVKGDVVWSPAEQKGFLHFAGLAKNDPEHVQYQLWIFDAERNEAHPVDGGVFDSMGGELLIPIDARVPVHRATLFAVTVEPPGGVVVSKRERIVVLAKPG